MKICPKMQERPYNAPKTFQWQECFSPGFRPYFDISINIHEYANEMRFILTHDINIFVIYCITGARASCQNDSNGQQFVYFKKRFSAPFLMFSLKFMNMQITKFALLTKGSI